VKLDHVEFKDPAPADLPGRGKGARVHGQGSPEGLRHEPDVLRYEIKKNARSWLVGVSSMISAAVWSVRQKKLRGPENAVLIYIASTLRTDGQSGR